MLLLDTNVAIHLRDGDAEIVEALRRVDDEPCLSIVSRIELEGGVVLGDLRDLGLRRERLDRLLRTLPIIEFGEDEADAYRYIIARTGFSRRKVLDRMIAAQGLALGATLITRNADDFRDVPGLQILEW